MCLGFCAGSENVQPQLGARARRVDETGSNHRHHLRHLLRVLGPVRPDRGQSRRIRRTKAPFRHLFTVWAPHHLATMERRKMQHSAVCCSVCLSGSQCHGSTFISMRISLANTIVCRESFFPRRLPIMLNELLRFLSSQSETHN